MKFDPFDRLSAMKLLLIRHAKAEDAPLLGLFARNKDAARRLTDEGRKQMRKAAKGLCEITPQIDLLATSPLVRARETAEIVAEIFDCDNPIEVPALASGTTPEAVMEWLSAQEVEGMIALVGHEPDLSRLVGWFLTGSAVSIVDFKKGAACLLGFDGAPAKGKGRLEWLVPPGAARKMD